MAWNRLLLILVMSNNYSVMFYICKPHTKYLQGYFYLILTISLLVDIYIIPPLLPLRTVSIKNLSQVTWPVRGLDGCPNRQCYSLYTEQRGKCFLPELLSVKNNLSSLLIFETDVLYRKIGKSQTLLLKNIEEIILNIRWLNNY